MVAGAAQRTRVRRRVWDWGRAAAGVLRRGWIGLRTGGGGSFPDCQSSTRSSRCAMKAAIKACTAAASLPHAASGMAAARIVASFSARWDG